jgi:hypothetical protein
MPETTRKNVLLHFLFLSLFDFSALYPRFRLNDNCASTSLLFLLSAQSARISKTVVIRVII